MADEVVLYLSENWSSEQIKAARDKVFSTHISGLNESTVVTGISFDGSSSSYTVAASHSERERFLRQCREALGILSGNSVMPAAGVKLDFSTRITST